MRWNKLSVNNIYLLNAAFMIDKRKTK